MFCLILNHLGKHNKWKTEMLMLRFLIPILPVLFLAGCTNAYKYAENATLIGTYHSSKTPQQFAECTFNSFQQGATLLTGGNINKLGDKYTIMATPDVVDAYPASGQTEVKYYSYRSKSFDPSQGIKHRIDSINSCV